MSLPFDGFKAAQTGLVDMGNISFYDNTSPPNPPTPPVFNVWELAQYRESFSEIVLNVTWAQLQSSQNALDTSFIDSAIAQVNAFNSTYHTDVGIKLRVWGGFAAPTWVKEINGAPITITGQNSVDPGSYEPQTIGRVWTADYVDAWQSLQDALAAKYDGMAIIRGISQTVGGAASDEPFVPLRTAAAVSTHPADGTVNQIAQLQMGGYTDAATMLTLRAAIADYYQWSTTPLDYTFNEFHLFDSGNELPDGNFTLAVLQQARNSARIVQAGNHAIRDPQYPPDNVVYGQLSQDAGVKPGAVPNSFQTAAPIILAGYPGWQGAVANGVLWNAGNIELWDFPTSPGVPNGFLSFTPDQIKGLAAILSAGSPPPTAGAPDDGSALGFIAPGVVTGAPGRIAFTGTDAVLLASATPQDFYSVTLASLGGGTLGIGGLTGLYGATSGATLSFSGSLSLVNTLLANVTDTVAAGTDIVQVVATDSAGNTATRTVGVQAAAPAVPPAVTPGLLTADQLFDFSGGIARVVGQGQAGSLTVAGQLGSNGMLIVAGVQSQFTVAGDLALTDDTSLLAALSPNAYSTASLAIGGTFSLAGTASTYFSGTLAASQITNGGTIRGNGTLDATGSNTITNTGTIEAVADYTLGSQRLVVSDNLTGPGKLTIDAGATLVLNGTVSGQAVTFADNTNAQLAQYPYSPSTLVLKDFATFDSAGSTIAGFTFADRLVLENVTLASGGASYSGTTLTVNLVGSAPTFTVTGTLTDLVAYAVQSGTSVIVTFVARPGGVAPTVSSPTLLRGTEGVQVVVPDVVLRTPLLQNDSPGTTTYSVTIEANDGVVRVAGFTHVELGGGRTSITIPNVAVTPATGPLPATTLAQIEQYLQTLTYQARNNTTDQLTITITPAGGTASSTSFTITNTPVAGAFEWLGGSADFSDAASWNVGATPPGGGNAALFNPGNHTATGDGAVGQIFDYGTTTLTGNITAQGIGDLAAVVDRGGTLTLTGGAVLSAEQQAIVGRTGQGLLVVAGGAMAMSGPATQEALVIGQQSGSTGTVLNLEQITALGTVVVGGAGTGTLELLGVAATMINGGADIGQSAGANGRVIVNGGEWTNNGLLAVGDAGAGALTINGMNRGITGQVTAWDMVIGNQMTGQGTVTLDGGELLVANVSSALSTLVVGNLGNGSLVLENGSEVAVGAAQGTLANNTGMLTVGGGAGNGLVRVGAYSSLLVYGDATIGDGTGSGHVIVGQGSDEGAAFAMNGTLDVGAHGQVTLGGGHALLRAANIDVAHGGSISGTGTVSGLGGGNHTVALTEIDNDGAITAQGGNLLLYGAVDGSGTLGIGNDATLTLQAAVEAGQTLSFANNSKLVLNDARAFHGSITGFGPDDLIDISGLQASNPRYVEGVLTLDTASGPLEIRLIGPYSTTSFSVRPDGFGGTYVSGGYGDVHVVSLDGFAYDFQAVGEYVAARGSSGGTPWQVQIQTDGQHGAASWTTGLAAQFGDTAVIFSVGKPITLHVEGAPDIVLKGDVPHALSGGTLTPLSADTWRVAWNSGEVITVSEHGISLDWQVSAHDPGSVQGLLGPNSAPWSYVNLPDGTIVRQAYSNDQIVGAYADGWRVAHSLFEHHHSPL